MSSSVATAAIDGMITRSANESINAVATVYDVVSALPDDVVSSAHRTGDITPDASLALIQAVSSEYQIVGGASEHRIGVRTRTESTFAVAPPR